MKSGTNQMHGSLFGFVQTTSLDAVNPYDRLAAITDPANATAYLTKSDSLNDWGGSVGGPIVKNKLFYFIAFERYMQDMWNVGPNSRTIPTDAMMGLDSSGNVVPYADLSPMLTTSSIVTTDKCGNTVYQGAIFNSATDCVFVDNQIPTNLISAKTEQILQLYHKYYAPESSSTLNDAGPADQPDPWFHDTRSSIKADYNISAKDHLSGSFYWDAYPRLQADQGGVWSTKAPYGGPMANSYWQRDKSPGTRLSEAHTFTANLLNTVYATFNRFYNPSIAASQSGKWDSQLGLLNGAGNFPLIYFDTGMYTNGANYQNGWNFSPLGSEFNDWYAGQTFLYSDELVWSHGRHNLKFGAEFRALQLNDHPDFDAFQDGFPIIFDPSTTAGDWYDWGGYQRVGNAFGSFLLGQVYNAESSNNDPEYGRRKTFSAYASDDIKVNPRLTVDLSLRWDFNGRYHEKYGHWSSFELGDMNPISGEIGEYEYLTNGSQSFERRQDYYNYSPHIGVAYKLTEKAVARANIGIFFTPLNLNQWGGVPYQESGDVGFHSVTQEGYEVTGTSFDWDNGYSPTSVQVKTPIYTTSDVVSVDPRALTPGNTQEYSVGVQRELDRLTKLDVNWIQSHSYHLQSGFFVTDQPTVANMQNFELYGQFPASYATNPYWGYGDDGWQGITPYPQVYANYGGPLFSVGSPLGNSDYKGLQFSVTRRSDKGLSLQGSYVWSRTHGDIDSDFQEQWYTGSLQNIYDLKDEAKDIEDFDETHVVKGYIIYNLPFGRDKKFLATANPLLNTVVEGWSLNGDFHYNTGTPISVHSTNYYPGFSAVYVDLVPGCKLTTGKRTLFQPYLNTSCFQNPTDYQLGTGGNYQSQVRNPGFSNEDLGLHKSVPMGEDGRYNFTFRLEFYNLFNRDELSGPDTNMSDSTFGEILTNANIGGRTGQLGARLTF